MASAKITHVRIDAKALEDAALDSKAIKTAVMDGARKIRDRANNASKGFKSDLFVVSQDGKNPIGTYRYTARKPNAGWLEAHPGAKLVGGQTPVYGYKSAGRTKRPLAFVFTANYAAVKNEHETNTLLKVSR